MRPSLSLDDLYNQAHLEIVQKLNKKGFVPVPCWYARAIGTDSAFAMDSRITERVAATRRLFDALVQALAIVTTKTRELAITFTLVGVSARVARRLATFVILRRQEVITYLNQVDDVGCTPQLLLKSSGH